MLIEETKKSKLVYAPDMPVEEPKKSKLAYAPVVEFAPNNGSNPISLNSKNSSKTGIDVIDEATAKMKLEITLKPNTSDETDHLVLQLHMEGFGRAYALQQEI
nr:hypothetical protein [Tanacetum cinerariifolium]